MILFLCIGQHAALQAGDGPDHRSPWLHVEGAGSQGACDEAAQQEQQHKEAQ